MSIEIPDVEGLVKLDPWWTMVERLLRMPLEAEDWVPWIPREGILTSRKD